jgi:hypothetical protein
MNALNNLDLGIVASLEAHIQEYGYTKTIQWLTNLDQYGLAQFAYGLYLMQYTRFISYERGEK